MAARTLRTFTNKWSRKLHRWGAVIAILPVLIVLVTGIILQLKKQSDWIQPPTIKGESKLSDVPGSTLTLEQILAIASTAEDAAIETWNEIDRLDIRPSKGIVKVRAESGYEVQIDLHTGEIVQVAYRRSDLIESIHDGSFFAGDLTKLYVFLPSGVILLCLWTTGVYLWLIPILAKRSGQKRRAANTTDAA